MSAAAKQTDWTGLPESSAAPVKEPHSASHSTELHRAYVAPLERDLERKKADLEAARIEHADPKFREGFRWELEQKETIVATAELKLGRVRALDLAAVAARLAELAKVYDRKVLAARIEQTVEKAAIAATLRLEVFEEMERHRAQLHSDLCECDDLRAQLAGFEKAKDYVGVSHRVGFAFDVLEPVKTRIDALLPPEPGHTTAGQARRAKLAYALGEHNNIL